MSFQLFSKKKEPIVSQLPQSTDYVPYHSYSFTLTEFGGKIEGGFREINNPTEADLKNAIDNLELYDGDFFTLISDEPINGYGMVGGMTLYGEKLLTASVHIDLGNVRGKHLGKSYDKAMTGNDLLKLTTDFLNCKTHNIKDGCVFDEDIHYPD